MCEHTVAPNQLKKRLLLKEFLIAVGVFLALVGDLYGVLLFEAREQIEFGAKRS